jgi:hypothetical protein
MPNSVAPDGRFRSLTKPINKLWELGSSYHRAFMLLETRVRASRYGDWALVSGKKSVIEIWSLERSSKQLAAAARELGRPENASSGTAYMCAPIWSPPGILYSGKVKLFISGSLTVFAGGSRAAAAYIYIYIGNWPRRHRWTQCTNELVTTRERRAAAARAAEHHEPGRDVPRGRPA